MTHPLHSQERTDWCSPPEVLERVRAVGPIILDPCAPITNPVRASMFYARRQPPCTPLVFNGGVWMGPDGLAATLPTVGLSFWNPPYGRHLSGEIDPFAEVWHKGVLMGHGVGWALKWARHDGQKIALVPNRTETEWWSVMSDASELLCFPDHRIPFVDPDTGKLGKQPNHGSTLFYHGGRHKDGRDFRAAFETFGRIYTGGALCAA